MLNNPFKLIIFTFLMSLNISQSQASSHYEKATLAGGCFWGMQELLGGLDGVIESDVGYIGGHAPNPTYEIISTGLSGYAEAIEITFDNKKISYEEILKFFFTIHNPTTLNRQQNDVGSQYRSEIFYHNDEQKNIAQNIIFQANDSGVFDGPVVTKLSKAGIFYLAEKYHQDYLEKNPYGYTCHHPRKEWEF